MFRGLHAENRHGPAGRVDKLRRALQFARVRLSLRRAASPAGTDVAGKGAQPDVLRESEENRAGPTALGGAHGIAENLRQHMGVQRLGGEFGDGAHDVDAVQRLMRVLEAVARLDLAADREHGITFRGGGREASDEIGDARPGGDETDADAAGHSTHGRRHEGGVLLVPADHELDLRVEQRDEDAVDLRSGMPNTWVTPWFSSSFTRACAPFIAMVEISGEGLKLGVSLVCEASGRQMRERGWGGRIRTSVWRNQNPLPYHLATPQRRDGVADAGATLKTRRAPRQPFATAQTAIAPAVAAAARKAAMFFA